MSNISPIPSPEGFQPYQTELRLNGTRLCKMFAAAIRYKHELELSDLNNKGKATAFEAFYTGLRGVSLPPKHLTLRPGIELIRDDEAGRRTVSILNETSSSLTEILKRNHLDYELDIVLSVRKSPSYLHRVFDRPPRIKEIVRIKGERTKRHEDEQLKKQAYNG